jgi:mono/diheme cytochrome c family protein
LAAPYLDPRPRDFTKGLFKFRSTPTGKVPTLDDLGRTVSHGLTGTAMGQWRELSTKDRRAVLLYIQTFSERFKTETTAPIKIPPEPPLTMESVKRGAKWYTEIECNKCHGPEGRGDGPSAAELTDDWDKRPIRPGDLTQGHRFKRGSTPKDIYLTLFTGLMGTPMPSVADTLENAEQEWDLVHYVYWLSRGKPRVLK